MIDEINFNFAEIRRSSADAVAAMREAAEELTRLQGENAQLRADFASAIARNAKLNQALGEAHYELSQVYDGADDGHWLMNTIGEVMGMLERVLK